MHFHLDEAIALAGLASSAFHVETEAAGIVAARARLRHFGKQLAQWPKQARVGCRIGARRAANGALVDFDDPVDFLETQNFLAGSHVHHGAVQLVIGVGVQSVVHQCGFARTGYAGHAGEEAKGKLRIHLLEIVAGGADHLDDTLGIPRCAQSRQRDLRAAGEILAGERIGMGFDFVRRALRDDPAAVHAGARADVEHRVCGANGFLIMFDHQHRIAEVAQMLERG